MRLKSLTSKNNENRKDKVFEFFCAFLNLKMRMKMSKIKNNQSIPKGLTLHNLDKKKILQIINEEGSEKIQVKEV